MSKCYAYYNEIEPFAAVWLRELIKAGHIAPGVVDERSIEDVSPQELKGFTQCHFFAGIGVWSYALRRAGWPDDRPVWTGSCPCQPYSSAGKGAGFADERHLWPAWYHLIQHGKPADVPIFGEQVASKAALPWLDLIQTDLEAAGHAIGAVDLCAAGIGAPHIRQRLFFVAERMGDAIDARLERFTGDGDDRYQPGRLDAQSHGPVAETGAVSGLADAESIGSDEGQSNGNRGIGGSGEKQGAECKRSSTSSGMADTDQLDDDRTGPDSSDDGGGRERPEGVLDEPLICRPGPTNGFWRDADWLGCRDGKWRPVEPGTFPLAHGAAARVGRLRGYGNAINAEVATAFIEAYLND